MSKRKNPSPVESIAAQGDAIASAAEDLLDIGEADHRDTETTENTNSKPLESKSEKFVRLANRRVSNALKAIGYVRNLANRAIYEYTPEQAQKVMEAIDQAAVALGVAFSSNKEEKKGWSL